MLGKRHKYMQIGLVKIQNLTRLAPMADVSDIPFRMVSRECGSDLVTSEEIDAKALCLGSERTKAMARYLPQEHPIALQLLGDDPDHLAEAARRLEGEGADIIDLNMGCPTPKVTSKGQGAALMKDPEKAAKIFQAMRRAIKVPLTIKIRGGWDEQHVNAVEIARIAHAQGVDAVTVHPRTRSQHFTGTAPWEIIRQVAQAIGIPVTGNGDVRSWADARRMVTETGVESVMIGRAAMGQPWIFDKNFDELSAGARLDYRRRVIWRHRELILEHLPSRIAFIRLKKNLVWYMSGLPHAASIRQKIFMAKDSETAWAVFQEHWPEQALCLAPA
ncbi:MAG: tRNA dihydrouridine synthase DusB [Elusimicrobiota bacterium]